MTYGKLLSLAQALLIVALLALGIRGLIAEPWLGWLSLVSLLMVGLATYEMKLSNLRVEPEPKEGAELRTGGVYRYIRHPMYSSLLFLSALLALGEGGWLGPVLWLGMLVVLHLKMQLEERFWCERTPAYTEYRKRTKRLIPFIY